MNLQDSGAIVAALDNALAEYIRFMMKHDFNIDVALLQDPESEEFNLMNSDGSPLSEEQYYALLFFERGWFSALQTVGNLGEELDTGGVVGYGRANDIDKENDAGDTDPRTGS